MPKPDTSTTWVKPPKGQTPNGPARSWPGTLTLPPELWPDTSGATDSAGSSDGSQSQLYSPNSVVTMLNEGFEGSFPSGAWTATGSPTTWDDETCKPWTGNKSAWCAGSTYACSGNYPDNMWSQMRWGGSSFNMTGANSGQVSWWQWYDIEEGWDSLFVGVSGDGQSYLGNFYTGNTFGWSKDSLNLCDYLGDGTVYLLFYFWSDTDINYAGVYVDDILVQKRTDGQPNLAGWVPETWDWAIVTSSVPGTSTFSDIRAGDTSYIDVAWANFGAACAGAHSARLLHNGSVIWFSEELSLPPGYGVAFADIMHTFPEASVEDTLTLVIDDTWQVNESNENDNVDTLFISIMCEQDDYTSGIGCSVTGETHLDVRTLCDGTRFFLTDFSRISGTTEYIETYRWLTETVISAVPPESEFEYSLCTDFDNTWDNSEAPRQCQVVDAHVNTGLTYDFMRDVLGRYSYDDLDTSMLCIVDDSLEWRRIGQIDSLLPTFNNAYWHPTSQVMTILHEGPGRRSLAGCLDVVAHEWGHAITAHESKLQYHGESGALDESFCDMLGVAVAQANGDADWLIGESSFPSPPYDPDWAFRNVAEPWESPPPDGPQPWIYEGTNWIPAGMPCDQSNDFCGVHTNSGVPNRMFYLLTEGGTQNGFTVDGIGIIEAMYIMYEANRAYWTDTTRLFQALNGCVDAAEDFDPTLVDKLQTQNAWYAVGVCDCVNRTNPYRDDWLDILDVVTTVNVAFRGFAAVKDNCPRELTDMNCDKATDILDVVSIINVAFRGIPSTILNCDACAP